MTSARITLSLPAMKLLGGRELRIEGDLLRAVPLGSALGFPVEERGSRGGGVVTIDDEASARLESLGCSRAAPFLLLVEGTAPAAWRLHHVTSGEPPRRKPYLRWWPAQDAPLLPEQEPADGLGLPFSQLVRDAYEIDRAASRSVGRPPPAVVEARIVIAQFETLVVGVGGIVPREAEKVRAVLASVARLSGETGELLMRLTASPDKQRDDINPKGTSDA